MGYKESDWYKYYQQNKKGIQVIEGILIILLLIFLNVNTYSSLKLQDKIKEDCGYSPEEDIMCVCEKNAAYNLRLAMDGQLLNITSNYNVSLDR